MYTNVLRIPLRRLLPSFALLLLAGILHADPVIRFEQRAVVASGVTKGATTVWLAIAHEPQATHVRIVDRTTLIEDEDRDGEVRLTLDRSVPPDAVWIVLDLADLRPATATGSPKGIRRRPFAPGAVHRTGGQDADFVSEPGEFLNFFVIRKNGGAWMWSAEDGGPRDGDHRDDGIVTVDVGAMEPVGASDAAPKKLKNGDRIFAIAPMSLQILDTVVTE